MEIVGDWMIGAARDETTIDKNLVAQFENMQNILLLKSIRFNIYFIYLVNTLLYT